MIFATTSEKFLSHSTAAYYKFEKHKTPFVAVKIYATGSMSDKARLDGIVRKNFRSEKDVILTSKNHYAVLLRNTSLGAAEEAMSRLSLKIRRLADTFGNHQATIQLNAFACLYGACEKTHKLRFKYLDLSNSHYQERNSETMPSNIGEYLKWFEPMKDKAYKPVSIVV
jgi:hypothetical protein